MPLDASQTASALQSGSVAAAIVNNNYATSAKLPEDDVIFQDDPADAAAAPVRQHLRRPRGGQATTRPT